MRKFWYFGKNHEHSVELELGKRRGTFALELQVGGGDGDVFMFHIALPFLLNLFFVLKSWGLSRKFNLPDSWPRTTGFYITPELMVAQIWNDDSVWRKGKSRHWSISPGQLLLGQQKFTRETLWEGIASVPMPEGEYEATVKHKRMTWTRKRFPFLRKTRTGWDFEFGDYGIPVPGKGENSWDLGEDAIYGISVSGDTLDDAIERVRESAFTSRDRYGGGRNWMPAAS